MNFTNETGKRYEGTTFEAPLTITANDISFINCTFLGDITVGAGENILFADCDMQNVSVTAARNVVLVNNRAARVYALGCRDLYVGDNQIAYTLHLQSNRYLIANGNTAGAVIHASNTEINGDNLTDIGARLAVGADEALLPHPDKNQFVGMERKKEVPGTGKPLYTYIMEQAKDGAVIYVPPGAYCVDEVLLLKKVQNLTLYAYGVYAEYPNGEGCHNLGMHLDLKSTVAVTVKGITLGYADQASGQIHILEKLGERRVRAVSGAGMTKEFGKTDERYYNATWVSWHRMSRGEPYAFCDTGFETIEKQGDGSMLLTLPQYLYDGIAPGDILTCRSAAKGATTIRTDATDKTVFEDVTVYGSSAGLCMLEEKNVGIMTYHRVADIAKAGVVIDQAEYDLYASYEKTYGVDLEISVDEFGNLRGAPAHIGSIDATHVAACAGGSRLVSCLFEDMCDDGTNQKSRHGRLYRVDDNGDGTATVIYKGNLPKTNVDRNYMKAGGYPADYRPGDRVYIYTAAGQLVCDTAALSATEVVGERESTFPGIPPMELRSVKIKAGTVNMEALAGYDFEDDSYESTHKVLIDNMTRSSNGFFMDNTVVKNTRSRGLLIKASDGVIQNCTFRNCAKCGVAIIYEIYWGESGVSENVTLENNLFDNTSYSTAAQVNYRHAPIVIAGIGGGRVEEEYLAYKNIRIIGNKFIHRNLHVNPYAIYVQAAKGVEIRNNDFGATPDGNTARAEALCLHGAVNIDLSDNRYAPGMTAAASVTGDHWRNLHGTDAVDIPTDKDE